MQKLMLDPSRWSYEDYAAFLTAYLKANWEKALPLVMQIVVGWTYDVPLSPDAYLDLPFDVLPEIAKTVNDTVSAYIEGLDISRVRVTLGNWKMRDFLDFREAGRKGDVQKVEELMVKACVVEGVEIGERLTFEQGALMSRALAEVTKGMFSTGK